MKNATWLLILSIILISDLSSAGELKIAVGSTPMASIFGPIKAPFERETGIKLVYPGPVEGLPGDEVFKMVDLGKVDGGAAGTPFVEWITLMKAQNYPIPDESVFKRRVIGYDHIKVITNKSLGVAELSQEQIKNIFTGKIFNWKSVKGPDLDILIVTSRAAQPATENYFKKMALDGAPISDRNLKDEADLLKMRKTVSTNRSAIAFCATGSVDDSVFVPKIPEIGRPITFMTKGPPSRAILKLLGFIQGAGRKYQRQ